MSFILFPGLIA